jgi:hypothetical protein
MLGVNPSDTDQISGCAGGEFCAATDQDEETRKACELYKACVREDKKLRFEGLVRGVEVPRFAVPEPPPEASPDEKCDRVQECPVVKQGTECTGRHHWVVADPPYKYEIDDEGWCIRSKRYDCSCCRATYEHADQPERVTFKQMQKEYQDAVQRQSTLSGEAAEEPVISLLDEQTMTGFTLHGSAEEEEVQLLSSAQLKFNIFGLFLLFIYLLW